MVLTPSRMPELGTEAPDFCLPDPDGRLVSRDDFPADNGLLVAFWCNHCPYVKHIKSGFAEFAREYQRKGLAIVAINANDIARQPQDSPQRMKDDIRDFGYSFAYLFDESQDVARAYKAACTPDFFLYDNSRRLVYRGQFDASRPRNGEPVTGRDLRAAVDAVLQRKAVPAEQIASIGCNIKWRD